MVRPVDLARLVGVSTQQIRNYADAGVLPPTPRSDSGYRQFGERHRLALLTFRALEAGFGGDPAREIMQAVHHHDVPRALSLVDAGHAALHEQRTSLHTIGEALEAIATQDDHPTPRAELRIGEAAAHLGLRPSALRVWEDAGLLTPARDRGTSYRRYRPTDVRDARMIKMLRQGRYPLPQIRPVLDGLRRTGGSDALRAAIADRRNQLTQRATAMLAGSSHLHHYLSEGKEGTERAPRAP